MKTFHSNQIISHLTNIFEQYKNDHLFVLLSGGSHIPIYSTLFNSLHFNLPHTTFALVDERYGKYDHNDSNTFQFKQAHIVQQLTNIQSEFIEILSPNKLSIEETATQANEMYRAKLNHSDKVLIVLGIGEDGHTAGLLPTQTEKEFEKLYGAQQPLIHYQADVQNSDNSHRQRITATPWLIKQADQVVMYAAGEGKKQIVETLVNKNLPYHQMPAQVLKQMKNVSFFTDTI